MRILLITGDTLAPWAITFRANELKKRWIDDDVEIASEFYGNPDDYDVVHILFSANIGIYKNMILEHPRRIFTSVVSANTMEYGFDSREDLKLIFENSKKVVCLNRMIQEQVITLMNPEYAENAVFIPNGVDEKLFDRKLVVGFVGSNFNHEYKGLSLIREACELIGAELLVHDCHYPEKVSERDEMPAFYKKIDCLCLASLGDGSNNPTLEALSMNKPVISTRTGIAEELEGVILVERNVASIIQGIRKFYPRKNIIENYTWDRIAKKYHQLYTK